MTPIRFLFITDTHIRGTNPQSRLDNFQEALKLKMAEVVDLANEHQVTALLHGGDLFDIPNPSLAVAQEVLAPLRRLEAPIYAIAGNHDLFAYNPETLPRTVLGFLAGMGFLHLIRPGERVFFDQGGSRVQLTGQEYHYEIDRRPRHLDYCVADKQADVAIHLVHGMLVDKPFLEGVAYTKIDDVLATEADLTLAGHYHPGWRDVLHEGKAWVNPGALVRLSSHPADVKRTPCAVLIEVAGKVTYRRLPLTRIQPGEAVLDTSRAELEAFKQARLNDFIAGIKAAGDVKAADLDGIIETVAGQQGLPALVKEEALRRVARAQELLLEGDDL